MNLSGSCLVNLQSHCAFSWACWDAGPRPAQAPDSAAPPTPGVAGKERDQLASALERLAEVQRELAEGQRNLMQGQKQLAEQQSKLVGLISSDNQ